MFDRFRIYKSEKGQGLVEFALVLPILLLIILGMVEFGWLLNAEISLTSAAREGARIGIVTKIEPDKKVQEAVEKALENTGIYDITGVPIKTTDTINNINNVVVTASGTINPIIGLFVTGPQTLSAKATMRVE